MLRDRDILYAPDYVINGGGIIRVAAQIEDWSDAEVERRVLGIADTLSVIFTRAARDGEPTNVIADRMAQERIARARVQAPKAAE
jgi:glutamate dehydrogenase/leucine dehydrogenase